MCVPSRGAAVTCGTVTWWSPWVGVFVVIVVSCGFCGFCCFCGLCILFVSVWKFPVCKLEVGLLNVFGLFFCCGLFGSFQSVSWKLDF